MHELFTDLDLDSPFLIKTNPGNEHEGVVVSPPILGLGRHWESAIRLGEGWLSSSPRWYKSIAERNGNREGQL